MAFPRQIEALGNAKVGGEESVAANWISNAALTRPRGAEGFEARSGIGKNIRTALAGEPRSVFEGAGFEA
jgi:hypothetical protein